MACLLLLLLLLLISFKVFKTLLLLLLLLLRCSRLNSIALKHSHGSLKTTVGKVHGLRVSESDVPGLGCSKNEGKERASAGISRPVSSC